MKTFKDTENIKFYNANPHNRRTDDCVIRALTLVLDKDYNEVYKELFELSLKTGYFISDTKNYAKYLETYGYVKMPQLRRTWDNTKYTGNEFCRYLRNNGNTKPIFANIGGNHCVAIINNCIYDTWDSSQGCIGNYWVKQ